MGSQYEGSSQPAHHIPPRYESNEPHIATPVNRIDRFYSHSLRNVSPSASPESPTLSDAEAQSACSGRARHENIPPHNYACFKQANIILRAMVFTENPWPNDAEKRRMVLKAWAQAIEWRKRNFERVGVSLDQNLTESVEPDAQTYAIVRCSSPVPDTANVRFSRRWLAISPRAEVGWSM